MHNIHTRTTKSYLFAASCLPHRLVPPHRTSPMGCSELRGGSRLDAVCVRYSLAPWHYSCSTAAAAAAEIRRIGQTEPPCLFPHSTLSRSRSTRPGEARESAIYSEARSRCRSVSYAARQARSAAWTATLLRNRVRLGWPSRSAESAAGLACDPDLLRRDPGEGLTARRVRAVCVFGVPNLSFRVS